MSQPLGSPQGNVGTHRDNLAGMASVGPSFEIPGAIIDAETLLEIRRDIKNTLTPSWFPGVPSHFGSARAGKLKASKWQAIIVLHAPLTLCRLWGDNGTGNSQQYEFLKNTMNLVAAVILATSFNTSPLIAKEYTTYMQAYLRGLKILFPQMDFVDTHHLALHIGELLNLLGPVHSWWMFPFERLIGQLQKVATNWIIGMSLIQLCHILINVSRSIGVDNVTDLHSCCKYSGFPIFFSGYSWIA